MLFTFYTSAKIHYAFHQFCFEHSNICSRLAVQHVCRIRCHVTLFYDVSFSLVKSHSLSNWNSRMLVELFFLSNVPSKKRLPKKIETFCCESNFFSLRKSNLRSAFFFAFCKIVDCGFSKKQLQTWIDSWTKPRSRFQNANVDEDCHSKRNANVNFWFLIWLSIET